MNIPGALVTYAKDVKTSFRKFHAAQFRDKGALLISCLEAFSEARMDRCRTSASRHIASELLSILGLSDFGDFRNFVSRREESRAIEYRKQRDHSAHTVNNYLLGWYFWSHSKRISSALLTEFSKRFTPGQTSELPYDSHDSYFGCIWQYVSLLHDIGYMFEGALEEDELGESHQLIDLGVKYVRRYFEYKIWETYGLDGLEARDRFVASLGPDLRPPQFAADISLGELADALRAPGSLTQLADITVKERLRHNRTSSRDPDPVALGRDTFQVWQHHYERFALPRMARRMGALRKIFYELHENGLPGGRTRVLDHGVCSGLLQFLASTYYYRLKAAASQTKSREKEIREFKKLGWDPDFWWTGITWATAACAVHNVQVMENLDELVTKIEWQPTLDLSEDPLAYLGILVDILQEWDRYPVHPRSSATPIQGHEMLLEYDSVHDRVVVTFLTEEGRRRADARVTELNRSLANWKWVLAIRAEM